MNVIDDYDYIRTLEDAEEIIQCAQLNVNEVQPTIQAVYLAENLQDYKLLELNNDVLTKLQIGDRITFRGQRNDKAVLCTNSNTYEVRQVELPTSLLLSPNLLINNNDEDETSSQRKILHKQIIGISNRYYELIPARPKLRKLRFLLGKYEFAGPELEPGFIETGVQMLSLNELLDSIQCSNGELHSALNNIDAFVINGIWRVLEFQYQFRVLSIFLNWLDENGWEIDEIEYTKTARTLDELIPIPVLNHLFQIYTCPSDKLPINSGERLHKLDNDKVCRFLGEVLLRTAGRIGLDDFTKAWQDSVPDGLQTDRSQLRGLGFIDDLSNPTSIVYFPETELPEDPVDRLDQIFNVKEKWTLEQIEPFITPIATPEFDTGNLLVKYTRISETHNGVEVYSSRYGK